MHELDEALLRQAHNGLWAMSKVCSAVRDNDLGAAERALAKVQEIAAELKTEVAEKARARVHIPDVRQGASVR
jgi:hypothetical protein